MTDEQDAFDDGERCVVRTFGGTQVRVRLSGEVDDETEAAIEELVRAVHRRIDQKQQRR